MSIGSSNPFNLLYALLALNHAVAYWLERRGGRGGLRGCHLLDAVVYGLLAMLH